MRGHVEYGFFGLPPFPPHFGPSGRGRSFGMPGWGYFDRPGCRPHGPPGCDHSPDRDGPSGCRRRGPGHHEHPRCEGRRHGPSRCSRRGPRDDHHGSSDNEDDNCCHEYGPRDHSPRRGPARGHHHHWPGPDRHSFGPWSCPRGFGPERHWPHFGPRFDHRGPGPYGRPGRCSPSRDCENRTSNENEDRRKKGEPCCNANKDQNATGDTVLVQRIIVERTPSRPQSV